MSSKLNMLDVDYSSDYYDRWENEPSCKKYLARQARPEVVSYTEYGDTISYNTKTKCWTLKYPQNKADVIKGRGLQELARFTFVSIKELKRMLA